MVVARRLPAGSGEVEQVHPLGGVYTGLDSVLSDSLFPLGVGRRPAAAVAASVSG